MEDVKIVYAGRLFPSLFEGHEHGSVVCGFVDLCVFPFGIYNDGSHVALLKARYKARHCSRLSATSSAEYPEVPRKNRFLVGWDGGSDVIVANRDAEFDVAFQT